MKSKISLKGFGRTMSYMRPRMLRYLTGLIFTGEESFGCMEEEDIDAFILLVKERLSPEDAKKVLNAYAAGGTCGPDDAPL